METLRVAIVSANNMNRSMEAHAHLKRLGYNVHSYGVRSMVRLPKWAKHRYQYLYGTTYLEIYEELKDENPKHYKKTGILEMLMRNSKIKDAPEYFQNADMMFDIIFTCDELAYERVCHQFESTMSVHNSPVLVINIESEDTAAESLRCAFEISYTLKRFLNCLPIKSKIVPDFRSFFY